LISKSISDRNFKKVCTESFSKNYFFVTKILLKKQSDNILSFKKKMVDSKLAVVACLSVVATILCIAGTAAPVQSISQSINQYDYSVWQSLWVTCRSVTPSIPELPNKCETIDLSTASQQGACSGLVSRYYAARAGAIISVLVYAGIAAAAILRLCSSRLPDRIVYFLLIVASVVLLITFPLVISIKTNPGCGYANDPNVNIGASGFLFLVSWIISVGLLFFEQRNLSSTATQSGAYTNVDNGNSVIVVAVTRSAGSV
jgi:hypothetical protein